MDASDIFSSVIVKAVRNSLGVEGGPPNRGSAIPVFQSTRSKRYSWRYNFEKLRKIQRAVSIQCCSRFRKAGRWEGGGGESCVMRHRPRCDARRDWLLALRHQNKGNLLATNAN
ncbi:hypothetical protein CDAR_506491 [Caerostris darwini]|uniref:Uncharacterized protein n=1 Tax=Caerostris darwini TaxID=1538125 RepID=A0AAV4QCD2_9ARAC|nr:hypothetical protein CDAR_506491 [Caerostris darwini]